jgi:AraC family transcriptional regulator of adaptative response/methylated-DNA-[protein]-cysteine methyltransferase
MTTMTAPFSPRTVAPRTERASVSFTTAPSPVGLVLVAHEDGSRALLAVLIGDDEKTLRADLAERFPDAHLAYAADSAETTALAQDVIRLIDAPLSATSLSLDPRGTAFQQRVWKALRTIPAGETTTYTELAKRIGAPKAVRAVAGACAANPLAIVVPCHRVVRNDGGLSGYRWGVERKRELLRREGALR